MAATQKEHYFYQGRKGKTGQSRPGILVVEGKYKFRFNQVNKANTVYKMYCVQQGNPEFSCKAKASVVRRDDETFFLYSCDGDHKHLVNSAIIIAEERKLRMAELVRKDPAAPVGEAISTIKIEAAQEYGDDDDKFLEITDALGGHHALEQKLLRVRDTIIGKMPRNRDLFDPNYFLKKVYGGNHNIEVMDSNKLPEGWQELIHKPNSNSVYNWDKLNDDMRDHEAPLDDVENIDGDLIEVESLGPDEHVEFGGEETENADGGRESPPPSTKCLPKRVLAYSSKKLLKMFSKCKKGSLDGTFKSCCKLWTQQFVFMLKSNKHWIPVVWSWLPDKTEESYKVRSLNYC